MMAYNSETNFAGRRAFRRVACDSTLYVHFHDDDRKPTEAWLRT